MNTLPRIHGARLIRHHVAVVCAALLALFATAVPAAAQEQRCEAPPGRSGIEQYCESLPQAGGPQGGGSEGSSGVDRGTAARLRSAGAEGAAVLGLSGGQGGSAESGAGSGSGAGDGGAQSGGGDSDRSQNEGSVAGTAEPVDIDEPSGSILSALKSSVEEGPTLSDAFAWLLIAIAIGCFTLAWLRWRRGSSGAGDQAA
jgi:hypothetical protein